MKKMRTKLTIAVKILGGYAAVFVAFALVALVALNILSSRTQDSVSLSLSDAESSLKYALAAQSNDLRGYLVRKDPNFLKEADSRMQLLDAAVSKVKATTTTEEGRLLSDKLEQATNDYKTIYANTIQTINQGKLAEGQALIMGDLRNQRKTIETSAAGLLKLRRASAATDAAQARAQAAQGQYIIIGLMVVASLLTVAVGLLLSKAISSPIRQAAEAAKRVAGGDLTVRELNVKSRDEIQEMADAFNGMLRNLKEIIGQITGGAQQLAATAEGLSQTSNQVGQSVTQVSTAVSGIASGAAEQSRNLGETAAGVTELKRVIDQIARGSQAQASSISSSTSDVQHMADAVAQIGQVATELEQSARTTAESAQNGGKTVKAAIESIERIRTSSAVVGQKIADLNGNSAKVGQIVQVIDEIAGQTNLLALNAAIEAARAGEAGRGFAVVAEEVRKLAERSSRATKEITELITSMQQGTSDAVRAMESGQQEVDQGSSLAAQAGQALEGIFVALDDTVSRIKAITSAAGQAAASSNSVVGSVDAAAAVTEENTAATEQMAASSNQVAESVEKAAAVAQENAASSEEVSASSEEMSAAVEEIVASSQSLADLSTRLQEMVGKFRL